MTPVRTNTALAGLGAIAAWLTFVSTAAPARAVVLTALVLLPGKAFGRRFALRPGWRPRVLGVAAGLVVALTIELLDRLAGPGPASTVAALVLLASSLGLLRAAPRVPRAVPLPDVQPLLEVATPVESSPSAPSVPATLPVVRAVRRAS